MVSDHSKALKSRIRGQFHFEDLSLVDQDDHGPCGVAPTDGWCERPIQMVPSVGGIVWGLSEMKATFLCLAKNTHVETGFE
jgi:hypothetical protein